MARRRGVRPTTVRLALSDGDWIDIKAQLMVGEERDIFALAVKTVRGTEAFDPDPQRFSFLAAATYIQAWSLIGPDDQPLSWPTGLEARVTALRALDGETMREIEAAIERHREAMAAGKVPAGESVSAATSPSAG